MNQKTLTLLAAACGLGISAVAFADSVPADESASADKGVPGIEVDRVPGDRVGVPGIDVDITHRMSSLDANRDDRISRTEAAGDSDLVAQFGNLDSNTDGSLDRAEYAMYKDPNP